jgi:hypothetical protein
MLYYVSVQLRCYVDGALHCTNSRQQRKLLQGKQHHQPQPAELPASAGPAGPHNLPQVAAAQQQVQQQQQQQQQQPQGPPTLQLGAVLS